MYLLSQRSVIGDRYTCSQIIKLYHVKNVVPKKSGKKEMGFLMPHLLLWDTCQYTLVSLLFDFFRVSIHYKCCILIGNIKIFNQYIFYISLDFVPRFNSTSYYWILYLIICLIKFFMRLVCLEIQIIAVLIWGKTKPRIKNCRWKNCLKICW